jgi:hypothetical protein
MPTPLQTLGLILATGALFVVIDDDANAGQALD